VLVVLCGLAAFFLGRRLIRIFFYSAREKMFRRLLITLFLLPSYAMLALILTINFNGLFAGNRTLEWNTNLVFFKNMHAACILGGIDDAQLAAGVQYADIMLVPGNFCGAIGPEVNHPGKHPYAVTLNNGALGIPYVVGITALPPA
jgi:hypothetical protein